jgi:hypothetical protein
MAENLNIDASIAAPTAITAQPHPGRTIHVEFVGNNESSFEIWRRHGDTVDWYLHTTTSDAAFDDADVKPGQYYEYKVRAVRGDSASEFSGSAVAYGAE